MSSGILDLIQSALLVNGTNISRKVRFNTAPPNEVEFFRNEPAATISNPAHIPVNDSRATMNQELERMTRERVRLQMEYISNQLRPILKNVQDQVMRDMWQITGRMFDKSTGDSYLNMMLIHSLTGTATEKFISLLQWLEDADGEMRGILGGSQPIPPSVFMEIQSRAMTYCIDGIDRITAANTYENAGHAGVMRIIDNAVKCVADVVESEFVEGYIAKRTTGAGAAEQRIVRGEVASFRQRLLGR